MAAGGVTGAVAGALFAIAACVNSKKKPDGDRSDSRFYSAGLEFGFTILIFIGIGWFLDSRLETLPLFLLVFMFVGFAGALVSLVKKTSSSSDTRRSKPPHE